MSHFDTEQRTQYRFEIRENVCRAKPWFVFDNKKKRVVFESDEQRDCSEWVQSELEAISWNTANRD